MSLAGFISATSHCINRHVQRISENDEGSSRRYIDIVKGVEFRESNRVMYMYAIEKNQNAKAKVGLIIKSP